MKVKLCSTNINNCFSINDIENELISINSTINLFDKLIKDNNISFEEYVDIINRIYNVTISDNDLINMVSYILGDTSKVVILNTDILGNTTKRIEVDNNFKYVEEVHKIYVKVAFTDAITDFNHEYSYYQILELVNSNKIVILDFIVHDDESYCENMSDFRELSSLNGVITDGFINLKYIKKEYVTSVYSFLKNTFSIYKINGDFEFYMNDLKSKLDNLNVYIYNLKNGYASKMLELDKILLECNKIRIRKK